MKPDPVLHRLRFVGGPLDTEREAATPLFAALGAASATWARLEQHVDAALIHLNQKRHSEQLFDPDHPVSFTKKLKLLKRWFVNQHPALAGDREENRDIATDLKVLSGDRNKFLHSIVDSYDPDTGTVAFIAVRALGEDKFNIARHVGTVASLLRFADQVNERHLRLAKISTTLFGPDAVARLRKA